VALPGGGCGNVAWSSGGRDSAAALTRTGARITLCRQRSGLAADARRSHVARAADAAERQGDKPFAAHTRSTTALPAVPFVLGHRDRQRRTEVSRVAPRSSISPGDETVPSSSFEAQWTWATRASASSSSSPPLCRPRGVRRSPDEWRDVRALEVARPSVNSRSRGHDDGGAGCRDQGAGGRDGHAPPPLGSSCAEYDQGGAGWAGRNRRPWSEHHDVDTSMSRGAAREQHDRRLFTRRFVENDYPAGKVTTSFAHQLDNGHRTASAARDGHRGRTAVPAPPMSGRSTLSENDHRVTRGRAHQ
jgi:hypothetical protein